MLISVKFSFSSPASNVGHYLPHFFFYLLWLLTLLRILLRPSQFFFCQEDIGFFLRNLDDLVYSILYNKFGGFCQLRNLLPLEEDFLICLEKKIRTFSLYFISVRGTIPYRTQRLHSHTGFLQHPIHRCGADHSLTKLSWINFHFLCWFFCISSQQVARSRDDFCHAPGDFH